MHEWTVAAQARFAETQAALQLVYDALNQGQQQKLLKEQRVKELLEHYEVKL